LHGAGVEIFGGCIEDLLEEEVGLFELVVKEEVSLGKFEFIKIMTPA
jgi:hypothetical protein